jgi:hypothetical protein
MLGAAPSIGVVSADGVSKKVGNLPKCLKVVTPAAEVMTTITQLCSYAVQLKWMEGCASYYPAQLF